jgi:hypothetical protein
MEGFISKHQKKIVGTLSCFDRMIIKGYLPLRTASQVENFLSDHNILLKKFKTFTERNTKILRNHAEAIARQHNRPCEFIGTTIRKDEYVRKIMERDNIKEGLICVLRFQEECPSYSLRYGENRPRLVPVRPKCLTIYFYFMDREFGLMHIRLQTWLPFIIQVYVNGHDWLAKQMDKKKLKYDKLENAFLKISDYEKAQEIADSFSKIGWVKKLTALSRRVNPLFQTILKGMDYYWVCDQVEYSTDLVFTDRPALESLYQNMQKHSSVCIQAEDILKLLGKKLDSRFRGEVGSIFKNRLPFTRVKHVAKENWIKMYDKFGIILRVETVINNPYMFKIRRRGIVNGKARVAWYPMTKGICNLYRFAELGYSANRRYLEMMEGIIDPQASFEKISKLCNPAFNGASRYRGLNPLKETDLKLIKVMNRGEYSIYGFKSCDIGKALGIEYSEDIIERRRQIARVTRILKLFHAHGLIAKIQNTRRYRITKYGTEMMSSILYLHDIKYPEMLEKAA